MEDTKAKLILCCTGVITPLASRLVRPSLYETTCTSPTCAVGIATVPLATRETIDIVTELKVGMIVATVPLPIATSSVMPKLKSKPGILSTKTITSSSPVRTPKGSAWVVT